MFSKPHIPPKLRLRTLASDGEAPDNTGSFARAHVPKPCNLCGGDTETPWHWANDCPGVGAGSPLTARRVEARTSAKLMLLELTGHLADADNSLTDLAEAARRAVADLSWSTQEGRWLFLRLLMALPFPAAAAAPTHDAVRALGALFDATRLDSRFLHQPAATWVKWAAKHSARLGRARLHAYTTPSVLARLGQAWGRDLPTSSDDEA
jgi:hypothetical protein